MKTVLQSHEFHFKCSLTMCGLWLPYYIDYNTNIKHFHYHSKFYWTALTYRLSVQSERSDKVKRLHKSSLWTFLPIPSYVCCCSLIISSLSAEIMTQESVGQPSIILLVFHSFEVMLYKTFCFITYILL